VKGFNLSKYKLELLSFGVDVCGHIYKVQMGRLIRNSLGCGFRRLGRQLGREERYMAETRECYKIITGVFPFLHSMKI